MDSERLKQMTIAGIDKVLGIRPWLSGITPEQRAVLMAHRQAAINDPNYIAIVMPLVGPFERTGQEQHDELMSTAKPDQRILYDVKSKDGE